MKIQLFIFILMFGFFESRGQETLSTFKEKITGTWEFKSGELSNRGESNSYINETKDEIVIGADGFVLFTKSDTTWSEIYLLTLIDENNTQKFYFKSISLFGEIRLDKENILSINKMKGSCTWEHYYYERKKEKAP